MPAGRHYLKICRDRSITRAPLRPASTLIAYPLKHFAFDSSQTAGIDTTTCPARDAIAHHIRTRHAKFSSESIANFSNSSLFFARSEKGERKFLKPRGKPKFRARTEDEHNEFTQVLEQAKKEYAVQTSQDMVEDEKQENRNSDIGGTQSSLSNAITDQHPGAFRSRNEATTSELEQELQYLSHNDPDPNTIYSILKILINDRELKPTTKLYEAIILANTWPEYGSVHNVESILSEMEVENIEIDASIVAAVLKVLAIHPSPELSHKMLTMVERRWIQLPPDTRHHLVLAMIRTRQTELAAWMLDVLRASSKSTRIWEREVTPDYLVVLLIVEMVRIADWEGVLRYMYKLRNRRAADRDIPIKFWGWLLERASKAARELTRTSTGPVASEDSLNELQAARATQLQTHQTVTSTSTYEVLPVPKPQPTPTRYQTQHSLSNPSTHLVQHLWTNYVANMSIHPSWTTCLDILHMAANIGTPSLATSVAATMTYLDGVDSTGVPRVNLGDDIRALVKRAGNKAKEIEIETARRQGRNLEAEKKAAEKAERERGRLEEEDHSWWKELMDGFDKETKQRRLKVDADAAQTSSVQHHQEPSTSSSVKDSSNSHLGKHRKLEKIASNPATSSATVTASDSSSIPTHQESQSPPPSQDQTPHSFPSPSPSQPTQRGKFLPFDPAEEPVANLWPLFPPIGSLGSAHVDPWDALGPRSSTRRKWTDAQRHYKMVDRANKKGK